MKKVKCINDKNLPLGAQLNSGTVYEVESEYLNALDQRVYIIIGVPNEGMTKLGMRWIGYNSSRFKEVDKIEEVKVEYEYQLN